MTIKMKYSEMIVKYNALAELADKKLPRKASTAMARNICKLKEEIDFYIKQRTDIADRYAKKDANGKVVVENGAYTFASNEYRDFFIEETEVLNNSEVEVDIITFDASELEQCDNLDRYDGLTPREEVNLSWMIKY